MSIDLKRGSAFVYSGSTRNRIFLFGRGVPLLTMNTPIMNDFRVHLRFAIAIQMEIEYCREQFMLATWMGCQINSTIICSLKIA